MKKIIFVVCVVVAATLTAYGQPRRGQRGMRPGQNQPAPTSTPTPASAPTGDAPATTKQPAQSSQGYKSAIEYQSLMQLRFYENRGGFMVENLEVVFPPAGQQKATFVISRAGGGVVSSVPLRLETPLASYTAFGMFLPDAVAGSADIGQPGDYVLSVNLDGQPITTARVSSQYAMRDTYWITKN